MVCSRCKMVVRQALENVGLHPVMINLGEIEIQETNIDAVKNELIKNLRSLGFEWLSDKNSRLVEKVKTTIVDIIQNKNGDLQSNLSDHLSKALLQDYHSISKLFTQVTGITIEQYFIQQKIEKVKELILYDELSLSEIAYQLHYSSVAHLSSQFKKITGLTPSHYRQLKENRRKQLEDI